ncbi:MAG: Fluoroacetate dehalogenase [Pseudomonadota bacterium]
MLDVLYPPLDWRVWRDDWPLTSCSQFVQSAGLRWHVQQQGRGPVMLLLHGTGASTHTWRDLVPVWAREFTVVSVDLPGHALTGPADLALMTLPGMAQAVQALMHALAMKPAVLVGHSAGAAVAAEVVLQMTAPKVDKPLLVALNPAWMPMHGWAGVLFAPAAKLVTLNPLSGWLMAKQAARGDLVQRVLLGTGSRLSAQGVSLYKRLFVQPVHVRGVLTMMERWDLSAWSLRLGQLDSPVLMLCGEQDRTIDPQSTRPLSQRLPMAHYEVLPDLGHLAHEEAPIDVAQRVSAWVKAARAEKDHSAQ